ncbi:MAG: acetolactate synthase large subunit, partial [Spirochaetales bacterium]|nr:acetolactate synthase large subunit [Spirochaetales bacterium]
SLDNGVIVTDVGQHQMWSALLYQFSRPRSFITSGGFGTMGFGLPASVGVQLANPDKKVICISGDGSIQINIQELATAVINRLPIIILILNNGFLGMVRQLQDMANDGRFEAVCLMNCHKHPSECKSAENDCRLFIPDFVKLAESYGAFGVRVTTDDELDKAIAEALLRENVPTIIDIITERKENVWPMVPAGSSLDEILSGGKPLSEGEIG